MSTDEPPPGSPDDPFAKRPRPGEPDSGGGSPYDRPGEQPPGGPPPNQPPPGSPYSGPHGAPPPGGGGPYGQGPGPYGQGPYDRGPYDQGPAGQGPYGPDPLAGMPPLAPAGKRVLARIIDIVIVLIPAFLLDWAAVGLHSDSFTTGRSAVGGVFTAGIGFLYEFFSTRATGQTVGKRSLGLRTAMLSDGSVPPPQASALRALILWLPAFCCSCVWFLIIGITVVFDRPYKQGVHDKAARTVVVEAT